MKIKKIVFLLIITWSALSFSSTMLVSDLDDTIKITNVENKAAASWNAYFSKKAFLGMPQLYHSLESQTTETFFLSGSPQFLEGRIMDFLAFHNLRYQELVLRDIFRQKDIYQFKLKTLIDFLNSRQDQVILIGDDTESDMDVYGEIARLYPERVVKIYIHKIKNKPVPDSMVGFYSAYDVALSEYKDGRFNFYDALMLGKVILLEKSLAKMLPDFVYCPKVTTDFNPAGSNLLTLLTYQINAKIMRFCKEEHGLQSATSQI